MSPKFGWRSIRGIIYTENRFYVPISHSTVETLYIPNASQLSGKQADRSFTGLSLKIPMLTEIQLIGYIDDLEVVVAGRTAKLLESAVETCLCSVTECVPPLRRRRNLEKLNNNNIHNIQTIKLFNTKKEVQTYIVIVYI